MTSAHAATGGAAPARVTIVGGGIIGLAVAWRCARRGLAVTVYDPDSGGGASAVAAGMLAPATEARPGEEPLHRLLLDSARRWPAFAAELTAATGVDVGYRTTGTLVVALTDDDLREVQRLCAFYDRHGLAVERLTAARLRELEPLLSPRVRGGALAPDDHSVDPRRVVTALRAATTGAGVTVVPTAVADLADVPADVVVLAAGHASGALSGLPVHPVKGQVVRLRSPDGAGLGHVVRGVAGGRHVYLVPRADGELIVGATSEERSDTAVTAGGVLDLLRPAADLFPGIVEYALTEAVAGLRPGTPDNAPILGTVGPRLVAATGHHRNGVLLTPVTADGIAALVATGSAPGFIRPFAPDRFAEVTR